MNGTSLALAIGTVAMRVGVPTAPISANTLSSSISLQRLHHRTIGIVAVVAADQFEFAAMDAALGVDLGEGGKNALSHALAERGGGTFERGGLAEQDRVRADADLVGLRARPAASSKRQAPIEPAVEDAS